MSKKKNFTRCVSYANEMNSNHERVCVGMYARMGIECKTVSVASLQYILLIYQ